jgi:hypothetical protein
VKVTPIRVPSVRELKQLYEKDVIQGRSSSDPSPAPLRTGRSASLVDFPDLGSSTSDEGGGECDGSDPSGHVEANGGQNVVAGSMGRKRGSKIVQQKAMLFGGVKWKPNNPAAAAATSSTSTPNLSSSPPLINESSGNQGGLRKPALGTSGTKAKDEIVRSHVAAAASGASMTSPAASPRIASKKERKDNNKKQKRSQKDKEGVEARSNVASIHFEDGRDDGDLHEDGKTSPAMSDKKRMRRALTDMGRPALPLFLRSSDDKAATKKASAESAAAAAAVCTTSWSSTDTDSLEAVSDEWGAYSSSSSPSTSTRRSPRSPLHADADPVRRLAFQLCVCVRV